MAELPDSEARAACDLDGVLTVGPGNGPYDFAPVRTGAKNFLKELQERYEEVYIHTARPVDAAKNWLRENGLLKYVAGVTNTNLPAKVYIDDRGVQFKGDFKATLMDIENFKPEGSGETSAKHEYASTQVNLPVDVAQKIIALGAEIPDEDLAEDGREAKPHITVLYGITKDDPGVVKKAVAGFGKVKARLGKTSVFSAGQSFSGSDVLKLDVHSSDLQRLRNLLENSVEFETDYPRYVPHITVAYLKPGKVEKYVKDRSLSGTEVVFDSMVFSSSSDEQTEIGL